MESSGANGAPLTQRFFGGGATGQRGFAYRRMSPEARTSKGDRVPVGGEGLIESSIETRIGLTEIKGNWLDLGLFLDAGDCTPTWRELEVTNLNYAAGAGLRYDTVVGSLRFDVGVRLNRLEQAGVDGLGNPDPGQRFAIHLSLGEAF
jgi:outer membrane translocation and assembly module TamA